MVFESKNCKMSSCLKFVFSNILSSPVQTQFVPVRYRYYAEKIARGPYSKKFGYNDKIFRQGVLPRIKDAEKLPMPVYTPGNPWSYDKVALGQNDYIDILGGGKLKPSDISYHVPKWLRGRKGNEMKLLLLKQKVYKNTAFEIENPSQFEKMSKRIHRLYKFLNRKTKTYYSEE